MAPKEPKISKQEAVGITRHITFIISETLKISMKPGSATCHSGIMVAQEIGLLAIYGTKKHKKKITGKKLGQ
jgi:hypothetical protein